MNGIWNSVWHQAMTCSFLKGKAFGCNKTIIFTIHTPVGGDKVRIQFSNRLGNEPYKIGAMTVAFNGKACPVTLQGKEAFAIPTGGCIFSDDLTLTVPAGSDLEVRMYYTTPIIDCNMIEEGASLIPGNQVHAAAYDMKKPWLAKVLGAYNAIPAIERIDVLSETPAKSIVAFGDSITALSRWTKPLAKRLEKAYGDEYVLLNSGISGNCLLYEPKGVFGPVFGDMGTKRFQRDVLEIPNLDTVILGLGVNDVSYYTEETKVTLNLEAYQRGIGRIVRQLKERDIRVVMQTISPRLGVARTMGKYTRPMEEQRLLFNDWIRSAGIFDYLFDAEAVVREERPDGYYYGEALQQGDHLHPNAAGGQKLADAYDLEQLTGRNQE